MDNFMSSWLLLKAYIGLHSKRRCFQVFFGTLSTSFNVRTKMFDPKLALNIEAILIKNFLSIQFVFSFTALTCMGDENKCAENECCVRVTNLMARCAKRKQEDERCEVNQLKMIFPEHVFRVMCPCAEGLKCVAKDGIIGKQIGTCQVDDDEE